MKIKSILSVLLCVALVFSILGISVSAVPETEVIDGVYELVAENEHNSLFLDKTTGNIVVRNTATGNLWYSAPVDEESDKNSVGIEKSNVKSPIVMQYLYRENAISADATGLEITNTAEECDEDSISVKKIKNGVKVTFTIDWLGVVIPVEYVLEGESLKASILYDELEEGSDIYIIYLKLLPGFGAGTMAEQGYLVIPDGSGTVINFNNGTGASEYVGYVYGNEIDPLSYVNKIQTEDVRLPIFGIVKSDRALLGVITEGDDSAAICAYSSFQKKYGYNTATSKAVYRYNSPVSMFGTDWEGKNIQNWTMCADSKKYTVSYYFLGAEKASYQGIASKYQDYLVDGGVLKKSKNAPTLHLDVYNSISKTSAFLGFKYQKQISLTTYKEAQKILKELKDAGLNDITAELIGWSGSGVSNEKIPTKVRHLSSVGGKKNFKKLKAFAEENGITLVANADFAYAAEMKRSDAIQSYFNKLLYKYLYRKSVFTERRSTAQLIADSDRVLSAGKSFLKSYSSTGLDTISMDTLGDYFYSNFSRKAPQSRKYLIENVQKLLAAYNEKGVSVSLADANAYTFKYVDTITAAPIGSSCYEMFDYDIPLYQMVLHGYITVTTESLPQTIDEELTYLWAVSTGTEPMYNTIYKKASVLQETEYDYLYSSTFDWWKDEAVAKYKEYSKLLANIYDKKITSYTEVLPNVVETIYEGGIQVYVNYNTTEVTVNGIKVAARSYEWIGGDSE
ncbi:MAG: hypothetical protein IJ426_07300 [Clostridia bacterium]|nr:hypothetical protein [Clostridia bacterium]